jgi:uncharacterized protein YjaG (DUF416 family)
MTYKEFTNEFQRKIKNLSYIKQLRLALFICKKLYFDYQSFSETHHFGTSDVLLDAITLAEQSLTTSFHSDSVKQILSHLEQITPDTENFADGSYALNACVAGCEILEFLLDKSSEHIYNIGTYLTDTVDFKIHERSKLTVNEIDNHPMMIKTRTLLLELAK